MATVYRPSLDDYLALVRRRAGLILGVFGAVVVGSLATALLVPPVYESTGTILVESQQIPQEFVQTTIPTAVDQRIQTVQQRVTTRDNMLRIIARHGLFQQEGEMAVTSKTLDRMLDSISVERIGASGRNAATVAFTLSFEHPDPNLAYRVANDLVTLFLSENARSRNARASEITEFLAQEARKLKARLATLEAEVAAYKQRHRDALPEHLALRMAMLQRVEAELTGVEREQRATQQELRFLDIELSAAKAGFGAPATLVESADPAVQLAERKQEYRRLLRDFTENHPDVIRARQTIAILEGELREAGKDGATPAVAAPSDFLVAQVQARIDAAQNRLASFAAQAADLRARMRQIEDQIFRTPQVERGLAGVVRDHQNALEKYEEVRAKQVDARIAESLEEASMAERFVLLEAPVLPETPARPDRKKILMFGLVLALGTPGGLVVLLELLNQRVRGMALLTHIARQRPLVAIPYIETPKERRRRLFRRLLVPVALLGFVVAAGALIHFFYRPLGAILMQIAASALAG